MSRIRMPVSPVAHAVATMLTLAFAAHEAQAHGAPEYPVSRQYSCYKDRNQEACRAAVAAGGEQALYDWNGVRQGDANGNHQAVVPDGTLCAGGAELFKGFNLARKDWRATSWAPGADGRYEFRYHATAPHSTRYFRFYLTRQGWDPAAHPLRWSDLDLAHEVPGSQVTLTADKRYVMRLPLPARTGRHLLYMVWQRADSPEAFYACSDVSFGGDTGVPPPTPLQQLGEVSARRDLPVNAVVKLRVFGRDGSDLETHSLTITSGLTSAAKWLAQLARSTNGRSAHVRVGELQNGSVVVPEASTLQVYALNADSGVRFQLDTTLPTNPPPPPPPPPPAPPPPAPTPGPTPAPTPAPNPGGSAWKEGASYTAGQVVTHNGKSWRCLQAHTAWVGAGWAPGAPGTAGLWQAK
ncbi:lytic polysaccharide monooxygenase [Eleftheria terrae]|uniref:lytic polysaccharide monooxygenase n=1 Tax=Eleftheria terrae TaxID=1597781 RepID=UPI00263AA8BB|nr:lytic polysaccharide monooxygenase [Eleftheria terrae]WKB53317.1 lytic polysaccharide monooxygenase [Eleftheria terrae]